MASPENCPDSKRLDAWLSGTLPDDERTSFVAHLDGCASCREELDRRLPAVEILGGLTPGAGDRGEGRGPALGPVLAALKEESPGDPTMNQTTEHAPAGETTIAGSPQSRRTTPGRREDVGFVSEKRGESSRRIGPYEVLERVGRGGMGEVFRAADPALERVVAIKTLAPALADSPEARRRFLREARAAAAVCHEHVVTIHAVGESGDLPYLVMQFVAGRSLQEKIDREAPLGLTEILRIGMQVASGLAAAHAQGLIHRDIKPANILLENGVERVKITDFGLARAAADPGLTRSGTIMGTPNYMSPEQARGEAVGPRSDLFSLGGVLYAMATGEPPFAADSAVAVLRRVCDDAPRPIRELNPESPDWLAATIVRLMAKQPEGRFATAEEVAELLRVRLVELQGTVPAAPLRPSKAWARRLGPWAAAALVSLGASIVFIALFAYLRPEWIDRRIETPPAAPAPGLSSSAARLARGLEYSRLDDWPRALSELDMVIRLSPEDAAAYEARAYVRLRTRDFQGAIADCDSALGIDPERSLVYAHRGAALNGLGEWGRARGELDEFIRRVPRDAWSHYHRGYSRMNLGDNDGALTDFDLAIELDPNVPRFHGERSLVLARRRDLDRALADVEKALRADPGHRDDLRLRGWIRAMSGDYDGALADYRLSFEGRPMDVVMLADRASATALSGRYEAAEPDFDEALRRDPSNGWIRARRALYLHAAKGDHKQAIADCDAALRLNPGYVEASLNRGLSLLALGDFRPAIGDFDAALDPGQSHLMTFFGLFYFRYPELYRARSEARRRLGDLDGALEDLDAALGLNPDDIEARVRRGRLHVSGRDFAKAIADFDRAIALGRGDADIYKDRGDARAAVGDEAGARADHDRADHLRAKVAPGGGAG